MGVNTVVSDNMALLEQGQQQLSRVPVSLYTHKQFSFQNGSIGAHFRHVLDHYQTFLAGIQQGSVDYDQRPRNPHLEEDPIVCGAHFLTVAKEFGTIPGRFSDLDMRVKLDSGKQAIWTRSSLIRELQFLLYHTLHHYALIRMIMEINNFEVEPTLGVSPPTWKYWTRSDVHAYLASV